MLDLNLKVVVRSASIFCDELDRQLGPAALAGAASISHVMLPATIRKVKLKAF